jgi:hypothetical protein
MAKALIALEKKGLINADPSLNNMVLNRPHGGKVKGVMIDLASVVSREDFMYAMKNESGLAPFDLNGGHYLMGRAIRTIGIVPGNWPEGVAESIFQGMHKKGADNVPPERIHTGLFGTSLKALITGDVQYNTLFEKQLIKEDIPANKARPLLPPSDSANINQRLLELAEKCIDPTVNITTEQAYAEYANIMSDANIQLQ